MEWLPYVSVVGVVLTILTAAAAAVAYYRATSAKTTIEIQSTTITALLQRVDGLEEESERWQRIATTMTRENEILRSALSGKADLQQIVGLIENHHQQVMDDRKVDREAHGARFERVDVALADVLGLLQNRRAGTP